jgi:transglutaminase-like putative cysteine protease
MKKVLTLRSSLSLIFLLIVLSALVSGIKTGVKGMADAAFLPVASFAVLLSFVVGSGRSSPRAAWTTFIVAGIGIIFIEAARLVEPVLELIKSIPAFQIEILRAVLEKSPPDVSFFGDRLVHVAGLSANYLSQILRETSSNPTVRETLWDVPIVLIASWAGWWTSRRTQPLTALAPSLALNGYILYYTNKEMISLQIAVFALVVLMGTHQKWNIARQKNENAEKARFETYSSVIILSLILASTAGFIPSISMKKVAEHFVGNDDFGRALGLERQVGTSHSISGLPRQHLLGLTPALSKEIIFVVKTGELPPSDKRILAEQVPNHHWRWLVYDIYDGAGWETSAAENDNYPANTSLFSKVGEQYYMIHQQVEKALPQDHRLYWAGSLIGVDQPFESSWRLAPSSLPSDINPLLVSDMLGALTDKDNYSADSVLPIITPTSLRASSQDYPPEIRAKYLTLPDTVTERTRQLASKLTSALGNPYDKARAIESYVRTFPYSLKVQPPPVGVDVADYFLFTLKSGYCDYYATSMIVLARSAGLPARLVIGYASGAYDAINAEYVVREQDAHSWVEIYFTGAGWVEFEPTAGQPLLTFPGASDQDPSLNLRGMAQDQINTSTKRGFFPELTLLSVIFPGAFLLLTSLIWFLRKQGLLRVHRSIHSIYAYVYYHGKKLYKNAPLNETPSHFATKLITRLRSGENWLTPAANEIEFLTNLYLQESFSAHPVLENERRQAVRVWRKLFWRLLFARMARMDFLI